MTLHLDTGLEPVPGYRLVRKLGRGGFGEVWEALAPGGVRVALKFIRLDTEEAVPEKRALEVIRDIRHPNLLDVQFAAQVEDCLVIAMPLCDQSLLDRLRECQAQGQAGLPREELRGYMDEVARAVDFLNEFRHRSEDGHMVGVQHRDIKPHNIFLVGGSARLADFGVAKVLETTHAGHTGRMTPQYAAPEMLEDKISRWSDQYALGVTYCQLRTGILPFTQSHLRLFQAPDLLSLPEEERKVVARTLAKRPEDRWPTCRDFVQALDAAARAEDSRLATPGAAARRADVTTDTGTVVNEPARASSPPSTEAATADPHRRLRHISLACVAAALACLAGYALVPGFGPHPRNDPSAGQLAKAEVEDPPPPAETKEQAGNNLPEPEQARVTEPAPSPTPDRPKPDPVREEPPAAETPKPAPHPAEPTPELALHARDLLKKYCYRCHGVRFEVPGYNVLDRDILVAKRDKDEPAYVVPGKPDESYLWDRVGVDKDMPPSGPKPSDDERALVRTWIAAGAPFPTADPSTRPLRTEKDVLAAIRDHQRRAAEGDRTFLRYFSLANLHNNKDVSADDLRLARAAVAKLANSLSWKNGIAVLKAIDPSPSEETILVLDIRDVGWDERDLWKKIVARYPYGLKHDKDRDPATRSLAEEVYSLAGSSMPYLRADWFVANASRPPLYDTLLEMPADATALERLLKVDVAADFLRDRLARAGFATSGVSSQNRLVDRHQALYGAYWKSYDFKHNEGKGNLFRFPLGPVFSANPFPGQAFEHAGGEIIFNLPNGLQGYLLVDAKDKRIDAGPVEVVSDALRTSGTAAIVAGLSCMACHQHGTIPLKDTIRAGLAIAGDARAKAERLFPEQEAMDRLLAKDEARFLKALDEAAGPFLKAGEDQKKTIKEFPEPIGAVARAYLKDLGPDDVAAELGLGDPRDLAAAIKANPRLRQLGLAPLLQGAAIKRTEWDSLAGRFISTFQDVARELELGTPFRSF